MRRLLALGLGAISVLAFAALMFAGTATTVRADHCNLLTDPTCTLSTPDAHGNQSQPTFAMPTGDPSASATPFVEIATPYSGPAPTANHDPVVLQDAPKPFEAVALTTVPHVQQSGNLTPLALVAMALFASLAVGCVGSFLRMREH